MSAVWSEQELERIGAAPELRISPARGDGSHYPDTPIWVVRVGSELYVRSWRGGAGGWFRAAVESGRAEIEAGRLKREVELVSVGAGVEGVDESYREKYGARSSYVEPMLRAEARETTLRLLPAGEG